MLQMILCVTMALMSARPFLCLIASINILYTPSRGYDITENQGVYSSSDRNGSYPSALSNWRDGLENCTFVVYVPSTCEHVLDLNGSMCAFCHDGKVNRTILCFLQYPLNLTKVLQGLSHENTTSLTLVLNNNGSGR